MFKSLHEEVTANYLRQVSPLQHSFLVTEQELQQHSGVTYALLIREKRGLSSSDYCRGIRARHMTFSNFKSRNASRLNTKPSET